MFRFGEEGPGESSSIRACADAKHSPTQNGAQRQRVRIIPTPKSQPSEAGAIWRGRFGKILRVFDLRADTRHFAE